ncbi:hypothetical protein ACIPR8_05450 [Stenotrophomonas sp. LARHCG68]
MPVTSVAELINLLASRRQASILHDRRTGMPYSWSNWLRTRASRGGSQFNDQDVRALMGARAAPARGTAPALMPLWQAIALMFWHGGDDPPPRDQRGLRWFSGFFSAGLHLLFAVLLLWVAMIRSNAPDASAEDGERVQVEYIGRGTPDAEGGGAPQAQGAPGAPAAPAASGDAASMAAAAQPQRGQDVPVDVAADVASEPSPVPAEESPTRTPAPPVAQPLQVTETAQPTTDFVLTPPTVQVPAVSLPSVTTPEVHVRERTVETATERPLVTSQVRQPTEVQAQVRAPDMQVRERQVEVAPRQQVQMAAVQVRGAEVQVRSREIAVRERQVEAAPHQAVSMAQVRSNAPEVQVKSPGMAVRERQMPGVAEAPATRSAEGAAQATSTAATGATTAATASSAPSAGNPAANAASSRSGSSAGAGPAAQDRSGGWAAATRGDDWGASRRQVEGSAGGQSDQGRGLFNADGSVRLAGDGEKGQEPKRGAPGGDSDSWTRERIAESGTWLKRPPYEFTPTSFDKYWVPNESLLAEWVRKGIKSIEIPIPGSSSKISCVVSMLQFGGGCGLTNPNMQEQPAEARPPPDIPFKKELQEDNGSR